MVLRLKTWESRSPPGLPSTGPQRPQKFRHTRRRPHKTTRHAGWSSPVARQAHNLKVAGSNPAPATKPKTPLKQQLGGVFCCLLSAAASRSAPILLHAKEGKDESDFGLRGGN